MALISCPRCGGVVSDKAEECPHCGAPVASMLNAAPIQPVYAAPYQPKSSGKIKIAIGLGVGAVVLLVVLIVVILITSSGSNNGNSAVSPANALSGVVQNNNSNGADTQINTYNVTLHVECRQNDKYNQYDVDIFVDDEPIATLAHGKIDEYALTLSEGTHKVEFRINGKHNILNGGGSIYDPKKSDTFNVQYINVSKDANYSYYAKLVTLDGIEIEQIA